jgi:Zn-finger nucleic acid-binding protein
MRRAIPLLCPLHRLPLSQSAKYGIEIDYCPHCYGAWFERGELDKVLEAYAALRPVPLPRGEWHAAREDGAPRGSRRRRLRGKDVAEFLEDLFDFD